MDSSANDKPGAHERHVLRKHDNTLFAHAPVAAQARRDARRMDQDEYNRFVAELQEALNQAAALDAQVDSEIVLDFKERLERLYVRAMSLGGDLRKHRQALLKLLDITMKTLERGAADDPPALQKLADEREARQVYFRLLEVPLVADLMRGDEVIDADELIPTLLSEEEASLNAVMELFEPQQLQALAAQAQVFAEQFDTLPAGASARLEQLLRRVEADGQIAH